MEEPVIYTVKLVLRAGEQIHISEEKFQNNSYAVILIEVPPLPHDMHPESKNFSVGCAIEHETVNGLIKESRWGWVHLGPDTKEIIGNALEKMKAMPNKWYYMLVSGGLGHSDEVK